MTGFDNEAIQKLVARAHLMLERELKCSSQPSRYLREIRAVTRELGPERIWWPLDESKTQIERGPHMTNITDATRMRRPTKKWKADRGPRFVMWDWEVVLCTADGERIEADPRRAIRGITAQQYWKEKEALGV